MSAFTDAIRRHFHHLEALQQEGQDVLLSSTEIKMVQDLLKSHEAWKRDCIRAKEKLNVYRDDSMKAEFPPHIKNIEDGIYTNLDRLVQSIGGVPETTSVPLFTEPRKKNPNLNVRTRMQDWISRKAHGREDL